MKEFEWYAWGRGGLCLMALVESYYENYSVRIYAPPPGGKWLLGVELEPNADQAWEYGTYPSQEAAKADALKALRHAIEMHIEYTEQSKHLIDEANARRRKLLDEWTK